MESIRVLAALFAAMSLVLLSPAPARQESQPLGNCVRCSGEGTRPCPSHSAAELAMEEKAEHCTHIARCERCSGTLRIDCDLCSAGDVAYAKAVAAKKQWVLSLKPHHDVLGREVRVGWSKHFEVTWEGGRGVVGRRSISEHESLHLYLDRCEEVYRVFCDTLGATDRDFSVRFRVMIWERYKDHRNAATHYHAQPNPNVGVKRLGGVGIYSVFLDPNTVDPDENAGAELHRNVVHNVAHLLLANAWDRKWPGEMAGGWIDEGLAHWFEDRLDKRCTNFCYTEQNTIQSFKGGRWRDPVKKLAGSRDRPPFAATAIKRSDELTLEEHALVWSYVDFLIARDGKGFGRICRAIKAGKPYREELERSFALNAITLEEEWKRHVRGYGR
jgi:hypothetical protein